jgi:N-hydroxyarylamine O-acetyltransferase
MDVAAYLSRIRYESQITPGVDHPNSDLLRGLHRAHLYTVPFENLDIHLGRKIVCDESRILHKIVKERRGGFCYELNGAFAALLRELGFKVTLLSARVTNDDGGDGPEFDHLALRVDLDEPWLADVGFGDSFLDPLRLETEQEQSQAGKVYRVATNPTSAGREFAVEKLTDKKWTRKYAFSLEPRELSDFSGMCDYHQTSPESHFTRQRICSMATREGRITLSDNTLSEKRGETREDTLLSDDQEWRAKLRDLFGIVLPRSHENPA